MGLLSVPQDKLRALLDVRSEEQLKALLAAYPGMAAYVGVVQPVIGAAELRGDGAPPLRIDSDGTVF